MSWMLKLRQNVADLMPLYSANRAWGEYAEAHYLSATLAYRQSAAGQNFSARWRSEPQPESHSDAKSAPIRKSK